MEDDGAMLIPQNRNPSAGRAGTPVKKTGTPTPQRSGSAPRASSGGRGKRIISLYIAPTPKRGASRSGAISRRKQRKFEMDNLFGLPNHASRSVFADDFGIDDDGAVKNFGLTIDWRCLFSELFREQNEQARISFLSCTDTQYEAPKFRSKVSKLSVELQAGEKGWSRIPKRLRPILQRAVEEDLSTSNSELGPVQFIRALESVIFYYIDTGFPAPVTSLPSALTERLSEPLSLKEAPTQRAHKEHSGSEDEDGWVHVETSDVTEDSKRDMGLELILEDSALHRLFLHAIVQFHGLQTRSFDSNGQRYDNGVKQQPRKSKKRNEISKQTKMADIRRPILIYRGKASHSMIPDKKERLSLISYLQFKQKQRDDSKLNLMLKRLSIEDD